MTRLSVHAEEHFKLRSAALYLLMAFIGGQGQSLYAVQAFVKRGLRCYRCVSMPTWRMRVPPCPNLQKSADKDAVGSACQGIPVPCKQEQKWLSWQLDPEAGTSSARVPSCPILITDNDAEGSPVKKHSGPT